jgi:preprotein translocase subunit Sss1
VTKEWWEQTVKQAHLYNVGVRPTWKEFQACPVVTHTVAAFVGLMVLPPSAS